MRPLLFAAAFVAVYTHGFEDKDYSAETAASVSRLTIAQDRDHQCYMEARANGAAVRFLIDTGAWTVSFGPSDLAGIGIDPGGLVYDHRVSTANGVGRAATIRLKRLEVAGLVLTDVDAQVNERGTSALLGASVLRHFKLEYGRGVCVLTPAIGDGRRLG